MSFPAPKVFFLLYVKRADPEYNDQVGRFTPEQAYRYTRS